VSSNSLFNFTSHSVLYLRLFFLIKFTEIKISIGHQFLVYLLQLYLPHFGVRFCHHLVDLFTCNPTILSHLAEMRHIRFLKFWFEYERIHLLIPYLRHIIELPPTLTVLLLLLLLYSLHTMLFSVICV
jgi:hypothetical protein